MPTIIPIPPPAPAAFTQEAMTAALPHACKLAMMLYGATTGSLPGDPIFTAHAADALARVNAALAIGQQGEALAAAARAAGEVA
jgi:hypothetical protein